MRYRGSSQSSGILLIVGGMLLIILIGGFLLIRLILGLLGIYCILRGLQLWYGSSSITYHWYSWRDRFKF